MERLNFWRLSTLTLLLIVLSACSAIGTVASKHSLLVSSKMSVPLRVEPLDSEQRSVYVDWQNNTAFNDFSKRAGLIEALGKRGYHVVDTPETAHYEMLVNVRRLAKMAPDRLEEEEAFWDPAMAGAPNAHEIRPGPYPIVPVNVSVGVDINLSKRDSERLLAAILVVALAETVGNALVHDVYYTTLTDLKITEHTDGGDRVMESHMVTYANQANLDLKSATAAIGDDLLDSIVSVF